MHTHVTNREWRLMGQNDAAGYTQAIVPFFPHERKTNPIFEAKSKGPAGSLQPGLFSGRWGGRIPHPDPSAFELPRQQPDVRIQFRVART